MALVSSARQAAHSAAGGTPLAGTNAMPGRAPNCSADAGHRLIPLPATMYSRHSSIVVAVAPMTGTSPPAGGLTGKPSPELAGSQPSVAGAAAIHGSPATSA